jgi:hypothetical protein
MVAALLFSLACVGTLVGGVRLCLSGHGWTRSPSVQVAEGNPHLDLAAVRRRERADGWGFVALGLAAGVVAGYLWVA